MLNYDELRNRLILAEDTVVNLRLTLKGMVSERVNTVIKIDGLVDVSHVDFVQEFARIHSERVCSILEKKIGEPSAKLRAAMEHINYLECHASSRGLPFSPFSVRAAR